MNVYVCPQCGPDAEGAEVHQEKHHMIPKFTVTIELPAWTACAAAVDRGEATALQQFIYSSEPAGDDEDIWRAQLKAALEEVAS